MQRKLSKIGLLLIIIIILNSCASTYNAINPVIVNYKSMDMKKDISLEYKYDLLSKKYAKKEIKKGVKVVAIKVSNNSDKDLVFGKDILLSYENGNEIYLLDNDKVFKSLKQNTVTYLFYLLLTPMKLFTTKTNSYGVQEQTSSIPIGLVIGPGIAGGNMLAAGSANKKFKTELLDFDLNGMTIKKGETKFGLIGISSRNHDAIRLKLIK